MPEAFIINAQVLKAVTKIFFRGCHVELERRRREDRGAEPRGVRFGEGLSPTQKFFAFLKIQNGELLCMPAWISVWYLVSWLTTKIANNFGGVLTPETPSPLVTALQALARRL